MPYSHASLVLPPLIVQEAQVGRGSAPAGTGKSIAPLAVHVVRVWECVVSLHALHDIAYCTCLRHNVIAVAITQCAHAHAAWAATSVHGRCCIVCRPQHPVAAMRSLLPSAREAALQLHHSLSTRLARLGTC